eukprot:gnl/Hemi2/15340_TR5165_c0_g1_i1.p1 gnl/Hemi2/15340_TR5165_c0_g1~~gnl/Hemi2/15340_TR5165_c0_g1_i1.p1  ORF type:complete len:188 (-),score=42.47 gnl/Hemi2/15340_TR5165_c0_g1_i1:93-593(-)
MEREPTLLDASPSVFLEPNTSSLLSADGPSFGDTGMTHELAAVSEAPNMALMTPTFARPESPLEDVFRAQTPASPPPMTPPTDQPRILHGLMAEAPLYGEIHSWFPGQESLATFESTVNPILIKGLTELCRVKPAAPITWLGHWLIANNPNAPLIQEPGDSRAVRV